MESIRDLVLSAVDEVNCGLPAGLALRKVDDARLMGPGREIDSLGLVMLFSAIETRLQRSFGIAVTLAVGSDGDEPFRTLRRLIAHVAECVGPGRS